jgi:glutamate---cysteine ligase / carboxylate-amine ligase
MPRSGSDVQYAFGASKPFSIGIEEELLLVDPQTRALAPVAARVLQRMDAPKSSASHEIYAAGVELRSPPSRDVAQAGGAIARLRRAAADAGATLIGAGVHPAGRFGDAELVDTDRYQFVGTSMRGLVARTPECALHVHVGMPDPDAAIRTFNGIRGDLPLLIALSANSPFWFGVDSGSASARFVLVRSYPRRAVPRSFRDLEEYEETIEHTVAAGGLEDYTFIWWDVRLHPRLGTIELREMDAQSRLEDNAAIAALVQSLCLQASERPAAGALPPEAIAESSFRASRDGLEATILREGEVLPMRDAVRRTLAAVAPHARTLGCDRELEGIERILSEGGGAARQRTAFARGGIDALIDQLVRETMADGDA